MKDNYIVIGSRGSKLALAQTGLIRAALSKNFPQLKIDVRIIKTTGDKILDTPLAKIGDKGLFTKELEEALLAVEIDLAVHSMKDLPTELPDGLEIGAVSAREEACDVLVSREAFTINNLPQGAKVGTSSLRRRAQVLALRQDLEVLDLRGNLDTRLAKLNSGRYDAIILAYAGIKRLGLDLNMSKLSFDEMLPQAGQGALGIEIRKNDLDVCNLINVLDDNDSRLSTEAERALLAGLGGGCQVPIGVYARIEGGKIAIKAGVFSLDGKRAIKDETAGDKKDALRLGKELAQALLKKGAKEILDEII
ncbi:MAG: hydroxymethylbilane synthase [Candidatus Omnitrophica bacterium CG11_big_fil_rev_8_21_14_0_20_42_13]|uniref:Porphobilinogen deaminase n=1 Tax=Candidatus Ghiorseimicrobium undicola TaxID=1974746 RepID=A0A2H0LYN7_9BACT|nr:MAG: hydroxymethylbilane synthase [Candidatus Omnitrophica bacterium CG11_big_fil_rev_8_21_14_0_20_42_13]